MKNDNISHLDDSKPRLRERAKAAIHSRQGIYLLPNLLTTAALFSGFYAVLASHHGDFELATIAIFVAMIFDGLDGRVARMTNTQSDFGVQYDSLADLISFGAAPAMLVYSWQLQHLGNLGWGIAFIYVACAAMRLARFNVKANKEEDKSFFIGLPSPLSAALVASLVWVGIRYQSAINDYLLLFLITIATLTAGLLMVSRLRYYSFKEVNLKGRIPFLAILVMAILFAAIATNPPLMLAIISIVYCCSAPAVRLLNLKKRTADQ